MSVGCHLYAKNPAPFARAIQHSGSPASFRCYSTEEHEFLYQRMLEYFEIPKDGPDRLARLQKIPNQEIAIATLDIYGTLEPLPSPCLDGWFFDEKYTPSPLSWSAPPSWCKAFILGNVASEGIIYRYVLAQETYENVRKWFLKHLSLENTDFIFALYGFHEDLTSAERLATLEKMFANSVFYLPDFARAQNISREKTSVPCYFYHFDEKCAFPDNIYRGEAFHAFDLLFVFLHKYEELTLEQKKLADAVHDAWVRFAHGEEPWEDYRVASRWRVWGPDGKIRMLAENEHETRCTPRLKTFMRRQDVIPGFARAIESVTIKPHLVEEKRPKGWSLQLVADFM